MLNRPPCAVAHTAAIAMAVTARLGQSWFDDARFESLGVMPDPSFELSRALAGALLWKCESLRQVTPSKKFAPFIDNASPTGVRAQGQANNAMDLASKTRKSS
jgi:hypothetical protein